MNFRIQQFLAAENISQSQLADSIGVARASISHIIAGRNKPGFDFIQNLSRHYPNLNLDWLINGKGRMYKDAAAMLEVPEVPTEGGQLFSDRQMEDPTPDQPAPEERAEELNDQEKIEYTDIYNATDETKHQINSRKIVRIVVFYDDNTYQELTEA
ncbi:MAG: helix-turn-helix transcriptional regulator [Bacteroidales bacterium]|nr:helix-turn-helix transcriptional regulator [Bacteroidales bacterium]